MAGDPSGSKYTRSSEPSLSVSGSYISISNCKVTAREISSPSGVCSTIPSLYYIPSPAPALSPSLPQFPSLSPSHSIFPSLSRSHSHRPMSPPHRCRRHCHCHCQDGTYHHSVLWDPRSSPHRDPRQLSHPNSVVQQPGSHLAHSAGSSVGQSVL